MNRIYLFLILMVASSFASMAQKVNRATAEEQQLMQGKITQAGKNMKTLQCAFIQSKKVGALNQLAVSRGEMFYSNDRRLRWEYTSPEQFLLVLRGEEVEVGGGESKTPIQGRSAKIFGRIIKVMLNIINGDGLNDDKNFKATWFYGKELWAVELEPKQKELKRMFPLIRIEFNVLDFSATTIELREKNGDTTLISFSNKKINSKIEDSVFKL